MILAGINYPVAVTIRVELKNGGRVSTRVMIFEKDKQLIETLWTRATEEKKDEDPRQQSIFDRTHTNSDRKEFTSVAGDKYRTKDGVAWEVEKKEPGHHVDPATGEITDIPLKHDPKKPCPYNRFDCQLTDCGTAECTVERERKYFDACESFGIYCDDDKACPQRSKCPRRALGETECKHNGAARKEAIATKKKQRGRPPKEPGKKPETERPTEPKNDDVAAIRHSGEMCNFKFLRCTDDCVDTRCMHHGADNRTLTQCGHLPDEKTCKGCREFCLYNLERDDRKAFCLEDRCESTCLNYWCVNYRDKSNVVLDSLHTKQQSWIRSHVKSPETNQNDNESSPNE